jgi:signal transduction histidine kinase
VQLAAELQRARLRIAEVREESRRRLGSDLHDSVGHQLTGLARKAEIARNLLDRDRAESHKLLVEISQSLNATISLVRSLAHQLHPPELELLGLAGALSERAQTNPGLVVRLDVPDPMPNLPIAIQTAAYYIALEALTNVEKHADARCCTIRIALLIGDTVPETPILEMEIADDGIGFSQTTRLEGLGLLSMQARAIEVGGTCEVEPTSRGGTRVSVRLPYQPDTG